MNMNTLGTLKGRVKKNSKKSDIVQKGFFLSFFLKNDKSGGGTNEDTVFWRYLLKEKGYDKKYGPVPSACACACVILGSSLIILESSWVILNLSRVILE